MAASDGQRDHIVTIADPKLPSIARMNDREKWLHASGGYDDVDRRIPRRLGVPDYLLWIARIDPGRVRRVPSLAVADDGSDEDGDFAFVSCPCGARPIVRERLGQCTGCERYFVLVARKVFVTYGAMAVPTRTGECPP